MPMDRKTIETYDLLAGEYDAQTADFWQRFPQTIFARFIQSVGKGKVIDIGSGPGRDGLLLTQQGFDVVCLDASHAMLDLCRLKGLRTSLADFTALPFPDASFDGAWAYTSLLHVPKAEARQAFQEIGRVLKPGGTLGLGLIEGQEELYRESAGPNKPRWFSFYTKTEIETLLSAHAFEVSYFEQVSPSSKKYLHFIAKKMPL
jgi:ubiquinone/menaquinone biosynthesis C-methylase UbiE